MNLKTAVQSLVDAFPTKGVTPQTLKVYLQNLEDLPEPLVVSAIVHLMRTNTFLPTIGEIRMLAAEAACGLPTEDAAVQEVKAAMRETIPGSGPWQVSPLVLEIVRAIGTWELRNDPDGKSFERFRRLYRERRGELVKSMAAGDLAVPLDSLPERRLTALPRVS